MRISAVAIVASVALAASQLALADVAAFSGDTSKHEPELKALRASYLGKIDLSADSLQDAVSELNATLAERDQPRINIAIRGDKAASDKVVIRRDDTDFAEAFDSACTQAGYTWGVILNRETGSITVIATPKKDKGG
ncbi:MAG: hypothetical protein AAGI48_11195 [Verrucomicrobiota bacterium]